MRVAWVAFAALAALAAALRGGERSAPDAVDRLRPSWFVVCPRSGPLLAGALLIGLGSSGLLDVRGRPRGRRGRRRARRGAARAGAGRRRVARRQPQRRSGRAARREGDDGLRVGAAGLALALLAAAPGSWLAVLPSAVLFGMAYNVLIAVEVIWSARVFASRPATGLAAVMFMLALGLLLGPAGGGVLADAAGMPAAFLAGAVVVAATALLTPREQLAPSRA